MSNNYQVGPNTVTKPAFIYVALLHGGFFGADLFFSSKEAFEEEHFGPLSQGSLLIPIVVPIDFDDWDYIPMDY